MSKSNSEHQDMKKRNIIKVGKFKISKHPPIPKTNHVNNIWIEREGGEGMSIDLDRLWKEKF